jgi:hypothetical protein
MRIDFVSDKEWMRLLLPLLSQQQQQQQQQLFIILTLETIYTVSVSAICICLRQF